jgi:Na+/H+ antiporter NhaA
LKKLKTLPWWTKIIAYLLSIIIAGVSLFFICAEGITFGDEKVSKWITSFMSSVFSSVFLTQPIQVALTTFLLVSIFRKNTEFSKVTVENEKRIETNPNEKTVQDLSSKQFLNQDIYLPKADHEFHTVRLERTKQRKLKQIFVKAIMHGVFLSALFITAYSRRNLNSYNYQTALNTLISNPNAVISYFFLCCELYLGEL